MSDNLINIENTRFLPPRVWVKKEKKIFDLACVDYQSGRVWYCSSLGVAPLPANSFIAVPLSNCILLHPTGQKDRNGVDIYQDDRVKFTLEQDWGPDLMMEGVVEYHPNEACWMLLVQNEGQSVALSDVCVYGLEVIGSAAGED